MKRNFRIYSAVSAVLVASLTMSCEDNLSEVSSSSPVIQNAPRATTEVVLQEIRQPQLDVKSVKLEKGDAEEIQQILKEIDPSLYQVEVHEDGKIINRLGSAAIYDLQKVGAYYSEEFGGRVAANEILTTVSNYIKTVWTADLLQNEKYKELVGRVESILNRNIVREVTLAKANIVSADIRNIQKALANVDPSLYKIEVRREGKLVNRLGSGAISDLRVAGAYYSPQFVDNFCGNEIITTVSNYVKTIWTAKLLESGKFQEEIARVESILNNSVIQ